MSDSHEERAQSRGREPCAPGTGPRTAEAGPTTYSAGISRELPLQSITIPCRDTREQHTPSSVEIDRAVSALTETGGLLHPITVRLRRRSTPEDETYELVCGRLRLEAARALGWEAVPCLVMELDDRAARRVSLIEDMCRKSDPQLVRAWQIEEVIRDFDGTQQDLAAMLSMTPSQISEATGFAAALTREEVQAAADSAGAEPDQVARLSRTALRRLKAAPSDERRLLLKHAAREAGKGRKPRLPPREAGDSMLVLADGLVRLNRARMRKLGVLGIVGAILRSLLKLVLSALSGSRIFAALRGAKISGANDGP